MLILSMVMMALGPFRFGINRAIYQNFSRSVTFRWEPQDRLGRVPALQYLGPGIEEITFEGVIYPHLKGGLRQVELMCLMARAGQPLMLVDGLGWVWQRWVITSVEEPKSVFLAYGAPRKIEFTISFMAYGADAA